MLSADDLARVKAEEAEQKRQAAELDALVADFIVENADGTLTVRLRCPITIGSEKVHRVTISRVKVRHVRQTRDVEGPDAVYAYAEQLVSPVGAHHELEAEFDLIAVMRAIDRQLGKYLAAGRSS